MKFIITVDTEADNQWKSSDLKLENIKFLERFQLLCEKFNFIPTYLITYEVATDPFAVLLFKKWLNDNKVEVGTHLHPWSTPPLSQLDHVRRFPCELNDSELRDKIVELHKIIEKNLSIKPTSYRAGRWGLNAYQIDILVELGYLVDSSITPGINWGLDGLGPDFSREEIYPRYLGDDGKILEVPMTILNTGLIKKDLKNLLKFLDLFGYVGNLLKKILFRKRWMRIFQETKLSELKKVYLSAKKNNVPYIQFMIHSSELMPGGSPYFKTPESVEKLYQLLSDFFLYLEKEEITSVTLSEYARKYKPSGPFVEKM